jgi:hypothetical protein
VHYKGKHPIKDGRVILFFAPNNDDEPRFMAFELDSLIPLFAKDIVSIFFICWLVGTREIIQ